MNKKKKKISKIFIIFLIILFILFGLIAVAVFFILGGGFFMELFSRPGTPEIKYGEFPFELVYEYNDEEFIINDTIRFRCINSFYKIYFQMTNHIFIPSIQSFYLS